MYSALIFDADGVVIVGAHAGDAFAREYGITREMTRSFFQSDFLDCLIGQADLKEVLPPHLKRWGWTGTVDEYTDFWFKVEHGVDDGLLAEIDRIRAAGTPCYLATNQERHRTAYLTEAMGLGRRFDGIFSSSAIGYRKPQAEFFAHITNALAPIAPAEIVFFDDTLANVAAARTAGWRAYHYMGIETLGGALSQFS